VWQGGAAAIDLIETHVEEFAISCGFQRVPGFLFASLHGSNDELEELHTEAELARELGFSTRFVANGPVLGKPAVSYADQALFHPLQYLAAIARAVDGDGSFVCDSCEVGEVLKDPTAVIVNGETVACDYVVIATHVPLTGTTGIVSSTLFQTKLYPYSSYVIGARLPKNTIAPGLYSDTSDPYYYLRIHAEGDHLYAIFGGEDHKTGQVEDTNTCFARLEGTLYKILPEAVIERRWSGQVIETNDGLPFVGETAENQFVGTGYSGNGLTFGTLAGLMAHDAVVNNKNPWQKLFDPNRKTLRDGLTTVIAENIDYPWYLILDRLRQHRGDGADNIAHGDGKVLTINGQRVARHRTDTGELITVSAVCTHMGCLVRWNAAERTWDCPCHGSRFTPAGLVLGGPAENPLEPVEHASARRL
jgi:glycine/D-amino acid oxidase-like deaminating enzyme/nitrite reductase/ring-hydroxylating ferredoxin subunit